MNEKIGYILYAILKAIISGLMYKYAGFELTIVVLLTLISIDIYWRDKI